MKANRPAGSLALSVTKMSARQLTLFLLFCGIGCIEAVSAERVATHKAVVVQEKDLLGRRFVTYSAVFAERFRLQPMQPAPSLGKGLEAVEIGIERRADSTLACYVAMYLTSASVPTDDLGKEASANLLEPDRHFFLRSAPGGGDRRHLISQPDASHLLVRQAKYFRQVGFTTSDFKEKTGGRTSTSIEEEVNELFPGINYVRTRGCMPVWMIAHGKDVVVGLRRKGAPDYSKIVGEWRDEHFILIDLSLPLLQAAQSTMQAYENYMQQLMDEQARRRRMKSER